MEHNDVVDPIQEFRSEVLLQLLLNLGLHLLIRVALVVVRREAEHEPLGHIATAQVGGHDDDGVLEVHDPPLGVRQATLFQDLQQRIEDVRVCLLHLIKENDTEGLTAHLLR